MSTSAFSIGSLTEAGGVLLPSGNVYEEAVENDISWCNIYYTYLARVLFETDPNPVRQSVVARFYAIGEPCQAWFEWLALHDPKELIRQVQQGKLRPPGEGNKGPGAPKERQEEARRAPRFRRRRAVVGEKTRISREVRQCLCALGKATVRKA